MRLTGYDLKKGIYTTIEAEVERPGSAVLNARLFTEMLRRLPDGIVTVEVDGKNAVKVKCGRSAYDFLAIDAAEYPELPEMDEAGGRLPPAEDAQGDDRRDDIRRLHQREPPRLHGQHVRDRRRPADRRLPWTATAWR